MSDDKHDDGSKHTFTVIDGGMSDSATHDATHNATHDVNSEDSDTLSDNNSDTSGHAAHNTATNIDRATDKKKPKRKLTAKQLKFAQLLVKGESQISAYEQCYDTKNMSKNACYRESSLLASHPMITQRLNEANSAKERLAVSSALARQQHVLNRLMIESDNGESNASSRIRALELLGRVAIDGPALFSERVEVTNTSPESADDVRRELESRLTQLLGQRKSS